MNNGFKFGLEAEYMLADSHTFKPLWYKDLKFQELDNIFANIDLTGLPPLDGLSAEPPHEKLMPFIVEGYGITDENFKVIDAHPKGVEIRTPVCQSIDQLFDVFEDCFGRFKKALNEHHFTPIAISHHPIETKFTGPQNKRRHDFWLWAMEVMTTYGPDINVSLPREVSDKLFSDIEDLEAKVNYYAPALAAISLASPFYHGHIWHHRQEIGLSYRTFKRSIVAPAIELHPDENFRIEFKVFEMTNKSIDFKNYFLLVLALFLDDKLAGRASKQERIYDLGLVARYGLRAPEMENRFLEIFKRAPTVLGQYGFNPDSLEGLIPRIENSMCPAKEMIHQFQQGSTLSEIMKELSMLHTLSGKVI